jgi:hypothetical protein
MRPTVLKQATADSDASHVRPVSGQHQPAFSSAVTAGGCKAEVFVGTTAGLVKPRRKKPTTNPKGKIIAININTDKRPMAKTVAGIPHSCEALPNAEMPFTQPYLEYYCCDPPLSPFMSVTNAPHVGLVPFSVYKNEYPFVVHRSASTGLQLYDVSPGYLAAHATIVFNFWQVSGQLLSTLLRFTYGGILKNVNSLVRFPCWITL